MLRLTISCRSIQLASFSDVTGMQQLTTGAKARRWRGPKADFDPWSRSLAVALAGLIFLLGAFAASPWAHGQLHHDAQDPAHACAITVTAHGYCDTTPAAIAVRHSPPTLACVVSIPSGHCWQIPAYWHAQALAPPQG